MQSSVASFECGLGDGSGGSFAEYGGGWCETWHECDYCPEHDKDDAGPDPSNERIEEGLDDGLTGVRICALVDDIEIPTGNRVDGDHCLRLRAGQIDALFRRDLIELFAVFVDVEQCVLRVVVRICVLRESDAFKGVGADGQCAVQGELALFAAVE